MAVLHCDFHSEAQSLSTSMTVILPQSTRSRVGVVAPEPAQPPPVLYLLHGLSDDHTTWLRRSSVERYVDALGLAVVMPQVHRSYYTDEAYGGRFWSFLSEELPTLVHDFFPISERREDTFVAGLSMGGYGAVKWALRQPERFAAAASLSGALDIASARTQRYRPEDPRMFQRIFGDLPVRGTDDDLIQLVSHADPAALPVLRLWCGTEDPLVGANTRFRDACASVGVPVGLVLDPGEHEWGYWDAKIRDVLAWLPLPARVSG
jgi:putative tributyrin esterase